MKLKSTDLKKRLFVRLNRWREKQEEERPPHANRAGVEDDFKFITVTHDMTTTEREEKQDLIKKARNMESNDEGPNKYRLRGPPWDMKIVELTPEGQVVKSH